MGKQAARFSKLGDMTQAVSRTFGCKMMNEAQAGRSPPSSPSHSTPPTWAFGIKPALACHGSPATRSCYTACAGPILGVAGEVRAAHAFG